VAEVVLQGSRVPAIIGELEPTRMPEHVRVDGELEPGADGKARQHLAEACGGHGGAALGHEDVAAAAIFALESPQRPHFLAAQLMHAGNAVLQAAHMDEAMQKVDLIPGQRAQLGDTQAVPEGDQDHGGIAQAIAAPAALGSRHETLYLLGGEVFARPNVPVAAPGGGTVPFRRVGRLLRRAVFVNDFIGYLSLTVL